jgi:serine/threonine-protein kinase RsbW
MKVKAMLAVDADPQNLALIRDFVEETALLLKVEPALIPGIQLAVDEAATNIIIHGYQNQGGNIKIEVGQERNDFIVRLRDEAAPFDPTSVPLPDITLPLEKRAPGGLGVYLIRRTMDDLFHRVIETGGNELTLIKRGVCSLEHRPGTGDGGPAT